MRDACALECSKNSIADIPMDLHFSLLAVAALQAHVGFYPSVRVVSMAEMVQGVVSQ